MLGVDWGHIGEEVTACIWRMGWVIVEYILYKTRGSLA